MAEEPKRQDKDAREPGEKNLWDKIKENYEAYLQYRWDNIERYVQRWNTIKGHLLDNPTLALTLLYLYATAMGITYSWVLYGSFGINIFDYSEIPDFLLAAFKDPIVSLETGL